MAEGVVVINGGMAGSQMPGGVEMKSEATPASKVGGCSPPI